MRYKKNYLASAGTGKTYNLVEEIIQNYIKNGITINQLFISTFTEKAAAELKKRIYKRLKEEIYKEKSENLQNSFYEIQNSYIGTLHSLLLRILKNHPEVSKVTDETRIVNGIEFDAIFNEIFEEFLFDNKKLIDEIIILINRKSYINKLFKDFYQNRWKLDFNEIKNINEERKKLQELKEKTLPILEILINDFYKNTIEFSKKYSKQVLKLYLVGIKDKLREDDFTGWSFNKKDLSKNSPKILRKVKNLTGEIKKELDKIDRELKNRKNELEPLENDLITCLIHIQKIAFNLNYLIILKHYREFEEKLNRKKSEENILDYDDILIKTLNIFNENQKIREKYIKKFKGVFIDEFQDTDKLQLEIIRILSSKSDLIVFGDPKQCIYEWRHANLDDYLKFIESNFDEKNTIDLDICFRSDIGLIGFFNLTFCKEYYDFLNKNISSLHLQKLYLKPLSFPSTKKISEKENFIHFIKMQKKEDEPFVLVEVIKNLYKEGYTPKDILILFRTATDTERYLKQLKINNIPFISFLESSFYKSQEILTVLNVLRLIQYPDNQLNIISVLKSPIFNFSDQDLLDLKNNFSIEKLKYLEEILEISKLKDKISLGDLVSKTFDKLGIFEIFSLFPDAKQKIINLQKLLEYSKKFERENFNLRDFINFLEENRDTREDEGILIEDDDFIKIMTMHKAKGLEEKVVIIPNLSKGSKNSNDGFFTINGKLMVQIKSNNKKIAESKNFDENLVKDKREKEEKRLLYVAFTRAKEKLIFIGSNSRNRSKMDDIEDLIKYVNDKKIKVEIKDPNSKKKVGEKLVEINVKKDESPLLKKEKEEYWENLAKNSKNLDKKLEKLAKEEEKRKKDYEKSVSTKRFIAVSELMKIKDEKYFLEMEQIKEVEETISFGNESTELGTFVHKILEKFSFTDKKEEAQKEINKLIDKYIDSVKEDYRKNIKEKALKILNKFLNSEIYKEISASNILFREMPFTLKEENRYIEGIIDIVYEKDNQIVVLDYKTTKITSKEKIEERYKIQSDYYTKAVRKIFPDKDIHFKFAILST